MHFKQQIWVTDDRIIFGWAVVLKDIAPISWRNKQPRPWYRVLKDCQTFVVCHTVRNKQQNQGFDVIEGIHSERRFQTSKHNPPPQKQLTMPSTPLLIAHLLLLINPLSRSLPNLALFHERFPLHLTPLSLNLFSSNGLFLPSTTPSHILNLFHRKIRPQSCILLWLIFLVHFPPP